MVELETVVSRENSARSSRPHSRIVSHRASRNLSPGASRSSSLSRTAQSQSRPVSVASLDVPAEPNVRMTRRRSHAASVMQQPEPVEHADNDDHDDDDDEAHTPSRGGRVYVGSSK